tara:strand:- start:348 stop:566 length:219 start_codon:yes stop_codon:yes gene_type:complete
MTLTAARIDQIIKGSVFGELPYAFNLSFNRSYRPKADGITLEEDAEIKRVWATMPGNTCYFDALLRIKKENR